MKQRVNVIRAFLGDPALLLIDEPFAALDVQNRLSLQRELLTLCDLTDKSVIFVTHDVDEALLLSDRVVVMNQPGCAIAADFEISSRRPRELPDLLQDDFVEMKRRIYSILGVEARSSVV